MSLLLSSRNECSDSEESLEGKRRDQTAWFLYAGLKFRGYLFQWFTCCCGDDGC